LPVGGYAVPLKDTEIKPIALASRPLATATLSAAPAAAKG
jgi:hypothetical protein